MRLLPFAALALFAFLTVQANAQVVWVSSGIYYNQQDNYVYAFSATEVDYYTWCYYYPAVDCYLYSEFSLVDSSSMVEYSGYYAEVDLWTEADPDTEYEVQGEHSLIQLTNEDPFSGSSPKRVGKF